MENKRKEEAGQGVTMQKEDFAALWKTIHLKVTDTYEVPPEILWVNGSTIGTLGNFSASTGKAKSKKTFNISAIVAAALKNDEVLKYSAYLPPNKRKILYVDTEHSPGNRCPAARNFHHPGLRRTNRTLGKKVPFHKCGSSRLL